jgi:hypothetical protein
MISSILSSAAIKQGLFANASIGFKDMIFLDLSGRNDWSSTLALTGNESYFYPAVGLSAIISQMVSLPSFITFGKVRGSYTTVANEVPFNIIDPNKNINQNMGVDAITIAPFFDAKPEMITSIEFGTDWRFLEGRVGFDFTYYSISSVDMFVTVPALAGSGYNNRRINAGEITNKGIELLVDAEPVSTGNFSWRTSINYSHNKNKIVVVDPERPNNPIGLGSSEGYYSYLRAGGSFADIWTLDFQYDDQGRIKLDDKNIPLKTANPVLMGKVDPDFQLGWNNSFSYKRFSLGFLVNGVFGGKVASQTESMLDAFGVTKRTADARDNGNVVKVNAVDPNGNAVSEVNAFDWYRNIGDRNGILAAYIYDRTNVRFTQFSLNYDIPVRALNLPLKSASIGLVGQNLFFLYRDAPHDPELAMDTGRNSQGLDNFNLPSTRTFGFNIKVNF